MQSNDHRPEAIVDAMRDEARRSLEIRERLADVVGKATSDDGHITAVVGPRGLQGLTFDPRVMRKPSVDLADEIVRVTALASENFIARRAELAAEFGAAERPDLATSLAQLQQLSDTIRGGSGDAQAIFERFRDQASGRR